MTIPANYTFVTTYDSSINAEKGSGILIGTSVGGAAIVSKKLDLAHDDVRYVDYSGLGNISGTQTGAIKFMMKAHYTGTPVTNDYTYITESYASNDDKNLITLYHSSSDGNLYPYIVDSTGVAINTSPIGLFSPISGQEYEMELNYNLTTGYIYVLVGGELIGTLSGKIGTRDTNVSLIRVGSNWDTTASTKSNFEISKLIMFSAVQHTARYIPGYCLGWAMETAPYLVNVYGFLKKPSDDGVASITVTATAQSRYNYGNLQVFSQDASVTTEATEGFWELPLLDTVTGGILYTFTFYQNNEILMQYTDIEIPKAETCVAFSDLVP